MLIKLVIYIIAMSYATTLDAISTNGPYHINFHLIVHDELRSVFI